MNSKQQDRDKQIIKWIVDTYGTEEEFRKGVNEWLKPIFSFYYDKNKLEEIFASFDTFKKALKDDGEFLTIFCLIYSFERRGFNAQIEIEWNECNGKKCQKKIGLHHVAVLATLKMIKGDRNLQELKKDDIIRAIKKLKGNEWKNDLEKASSICKISNPNALKNKKLNKEITNEKYIYSYIKFLKDSKAKELIKNINELEKYK